MDMARSGTGRIVLTGRVWSGGVVEPGDLFAPTTARRPRSRDHGDRPRSAAVTASP